MPSNIAKSIIYGIFASVILLGVYFVVLTLVSGWGFTISQFFTFWYFIVSLAMALAFKSAYISTSKI